MAEKYDIIRPFKPGTYESKMFPKSEDEDYMHYVITEGGKLTYDTGASVGLGEEWTRWIAELGPFRLIEESKPREPKAHTTTVIKARESWTRKNRVVSITSGHAAISMTIANDPTPYPFDGDGRTTLTPDQAEQIANDILERVAEIRRANEEAGA